MSGGGQARVEHKYVMKDIGIDEKVTTFLEVLRPEGLNNSMTFNSIIIKNKIFKLL